MDFSTSSNFDFLACHDAVFVRLAAAAEAYMASDPNAALYKLRLFGEVLAQNVAARVGLLTRQDETQHDLLLRLQDRGVVVGAARELFHGLRRQGNRAVHQGTGDRDEALHQLRMARQLAVWFHRTFGDDPQFVPPPFVVPPDRTRELADEILRLRRELEEQQETFEREKARMTEQLLTIQTAAQAAPATNVQATIDRAARLSEAIELDETATRRIIDQQLRDAGWEADSEELRYSRGTRPQKGKNLAIAEWPTASGLVDYALFHGLHAVGVIEAKRQSVDVVSVVQQAKRYSRGFSFEGGAEMLGGPFGEHRIPFVFATNGRPYLRQLESKSGIWFADLRRRENLPRALSGWYTPDGLFALFKQDIVAAQEKLDEEPTDYLSLRDYQLRAVRAVEAALGEGRTSCLVAMATGTGKTITALSLVYRLIKAKRFRRILFLVDRSALGEQTADAFKDIRLENLQTFTDIFDLKELGDIAPEPETKVQIATVQAMARRILRADDPSSAPPIDTYDCLIVDECHRGYTLDRELSDDELQFRDFDDYVSKYRRVLDHFDAVKIGLTATPALHTTEIFGAPIYRYSYREAVIDGWLVDHAPPYQIVTELGEGGIHFEQGEQVNRYDPAEGNVDLVHLDDELHFEIDAFHRTVITENFNRVVCHELAKYIDPSLPTKTLVYCVNDQHADLVVTLLARALEAQYGSIDSDTVLKITGRADDPRMLIRRFKNESLPNIAVTVDLLTTGIDVPAIGNLVFLRRVKSRILYEQMLGRATRLCPEIDKQEFRIFDAVKLYEALEEVTDMKPVVRDPSLSFQRLVHELATVRDERLRQGILEEIVAKLHRKAPRIRGEELGQFEHLAGQGPREVARMLRKCSPSEASTWFEERSFLVNLLDRPAGSGRGVYISTHEDAVKRVERGYGDATKPEDYLSSFSAFVRDNLNEIPALLLVTQRPRELTRAALKDLAMILDQNGFTETNLQTAWREKTNTDIAASIIGFIRQAALGDPLLPYDQRVDRALRAIESSRPLTEVQRNWLNRIAKAMKNDRIVDREALDRGQFKTQGGFDRLNKVFDGQLEALLGDLAQAVWSETG